MGDVILIIYILKIPKNVTEKVCLIMNIIILFIKSTICPSLL